jgi:pyruvate dehydrogenase E1 component alpha subunit
MTELTLLKNLLRIRLMEELCLEFYTQEKIRGFLHLYIGQEAIATGVLSCLRPPDNVIATYREHGHALLKGVPAKFIMAEMFGKRTGVCGGRGGSMHLISREHRFFGGNAIVAAGIPHAVGLSLASLKLNQDRRTVCFFGEGAAAEGVFHEALNLSSLWQIPVLFCCENNLYAMGTALVRSQAQINPVLKAKGHNIEGQSVDGMNLNEVIQKTKEAIEYMEREQKPYFLEFRTYRFRPHSIFDPDLYRTKEEIKLWQKNDPIKNYQSYLKENNKLTQDQLLVIQNQVNQEMSEAVEFALNSPDPDESSLEHFLYGDDSWK